MGKPQDLTVVACHGYHGRADVFQFIPSSPNWYAYKLGVFLRASGRAEPSAVYMSRGYTIRCRDMLFQPNDDASSFERLR